MIDDGFEHRRQIPRTGVRVEAGIAVAAGGIEHREIELVVAGVEADEQIEHFVKHFLDALVGTVHLRSEEHTSELQSLMRISYAVFCLKKKKNKCQKNNSIPLDNTQPDRGTLHDTNEKQEQHMSSTQ